MRFRDSQGRLRGFHEVGCASECFRLTFKDILRAFEGWSQGCFRGSLKGGFRDVSSVQKVSGSLRGASGVFERTLEEF